MNRVFGLFLACILLGTARVRSVEANVLVIPVGDERPGAVYFVDECLTRGLTNSISLTELRRWATNTIALYQQNQRSGKVADADVPESIKTIDTRIPSCRVSQSSEVISGWHELVAFMAEANGIGEQEAENRLRTISPNRKEPWVTLSRLGDIPALSINWYLYGIVVGPESFVPREDWNPWYKRKLADGIYLWHGYK